MNKLKESFVRYMNKEGIRFTDLDESRVKVSYSGDNMSSIPVIVIFDESETVHFVVWSIAKFNDNKYANGLIMCNTLNQKYRWVKFYLDKDQEVAADMDAILDENSLGAECKQCILRIVNIVDEAYPEFMKALYA